MSSFQTKTNKVRIITFYIFKKLNFFDKIIVYSSKIFDYPKEMKLNCLNNFFCKDAVNFSGKATSCLIPLTSGPR